MQEEFTGTPQINEVADNFIPVQPGNPLKEVSKPPFFSFNFNTLLGLVLLAGLIVLYVLFFNSRKPHEMSVPLTIQKASGKAISVVYVNLDSLNAHYDYVKILRHDLESTSKKLQSDLLAEQSALEKEGAEFQRQVSAGGDFGGKGQGSL